MSNHARPPIDANAAAVRYSGPPADRMAGRPGTRTQAAAAPARRAPAAVPQPATQAAARQPQVSAATERRVQTRLAAEDLIDRAVHAGVINEGTRAHYVAAYAADPAGTRQFLSDLGLRDAQVTAQTADYDDTFLTPREREHVAAARDGKRGRIVNL
jgi:hypothetical protein